MDSLTTNGYVIHLRRRRGPSGVHVASNTPSNVPRLEKSSLLRSSSSCRIAFAPNFTCFGGASGAIRGPACSSAASEKVSRYYAQWYSAVTNSRGDVSAKLVRNCLVWAEVAGKGCTSIQSTSFSVVVADACGRVAVPLENVWNVLEEPLEGGWSQWLRGIRSTRQPRAKPCEWGTHVIHLCGENLWVGRMQRGVGFAFGVVGT